MAVTQSHFRFGINEGDEATHGWYAGEDVSPLPGTIPLDTTFLLRFTLQCNATQQANVDCNFEYSLNGGTYTQITTSSSVVRAVDGVLTNGGNTTKRLSGTGTFIGATGQTEDGISGGTAFDIPANGNGETECALQLLSANLSPGDVIDFRLTRDAQVLIDTYAVTPSLKVPVVHTESYKVADVVTASLAVLLLTLGAEGVKVSDTVQAALVDLDHSISVVAEEAKADDGGRVDLYGLGNPIRIADGPVLAEVVTPGINASLTETLKVADAALLTLDPLQAEPAESLKVVDVAAGGFELSASPSESLAVADTLGLTLNPEQTSPVESTKVDDGGRVDLMGLGNPVKITDGPVSAQLVSAGLSIGVDVEALGVTDTVLVIINPEETALQESVKVVDTLAAELGVYTVVLSEALKVADLLTVAITPEQAIASEALSVIDTHSVSLNPEQATPSESLKVVDEVSAARIDAGALAATLSEGLIVSDATLLSFIDPSQASTSEALKVVDTANAALTIDLSANISESIKVDDEGEVELSRDETIRISEVLTAVLGVAASASESLKVADSASATLSATGDLSVSVAEGLRINDSGEVELVQFEAVRISEELAVEFAGTLNRSISESLKVSDGPVNTASSLLSVALIEGLKFVDTGEAELVEHETIRVSDSISVFLFEAGSLLFATPAAESLKVAEVVSTTLDPERANPAEHLKVRDTVTVAVQTFDLAVAVSEALSVVDTPDVIAQLGVLLAEGLAVVDAVPVGQLDPLEILLAEGLGIADASPSITIGTTIAVLEAEGSRIADSLAASLDPELLSLSEPLGVSDAVLATLDPEQSGISEGLVVQDAVQASLDRLDVLIAEGLSIVDGPPRFGGPSTILVTGSYVTTIEVAGSYVTSITVVGEVV